LIIDWTETPYSTFPLAKSSNRETLRVISYLLLKYLSGEKIKTDKEKCLTFDEPVMLKVSNENSNYLSHL